MGHQHCPTCNGKGMVIGGADYNGLPKWNVCLMCTGTGRVPDFGARTHNLSSGMPVDRRGGRAVEPSRLDLFVRSIPGWVHLSLGIVGAVIGVGRAVDTGGSLLSHGLLGGLAGLAGIALATIALKFLVLVFQLVIFAGGLYVLYILFRSWVENR